MEVQKKKKKNAHLWSLEEEKTKRAPLVTGRRKKNTRRKFSCAPLVTVL
jgi:hypothetical protein